MASCAEAPMALLRQQAEEDVAEEDRRTTGGLPPGEDLKGLFFSVRSRTPIVAPVKGMRGGGSSKP